MNFIQLKDKNGLNFVSDIILPHYDSFIHSNEIFKKTLIEFEQETKQNIIKLNDASALIFSKLKKFIV